MPGRENDSQITLCKKLCKNNRGIGIQLAALGKRIYEIARHRGIWTDVPSELFVTKRTGTWVPRASRPDDDEEWILKDRNI